MSKTRKQTRLAIAAAIAAISVGLGAAEAAATTYSWNATGGTQAAPLLWSNSGNWVNGVGPSAGSSTTALTFGSATYGGTASWVSNDISTLFQVNQLTLTSTAAQNLEGSSLRFSADGTTAPSIQQNGSGQFTLYNAMSVDPGTTLKVSGTGSGQLQFYGGIGGSGAMEVNVSGSATVALSQASTFTGGLTLTAGKLAITTSSSGTYGQSGYTSGAGAGQVTLNGGTVRSSTSSNKSIANPVMIGGNVSFGDSSSACTLTFTGPTTLSGATRVLTLVSSGGTASPVAFTGAIGGDGGMELAGIGTLSLGTGATDTVANTYTGLTKLNSSTATLTLNKAAGTNAIAGDLYCQAGALNWAQANQIADTSNVTIAGSTVTFTANETVSNVTVSSGSFKSTSGTSVNVAGLTISGGANNAQGGTLTVGASGLTIAAPSNGSTIFDALAMNNSGAGVLKLAGNVTVNASPSPARIKQGGAGGYLDLNGAQRTFSVADGASTEDLSITVIIKDSTGAGGGIRKTGLGTLALPNATDGSLTGDSVVAAGTLAIYNHNDDPSQGGSAIGSGRLSVNQGATLAGNGRISGAVTVSGTVDPGIPSRSDLGGTYSTNPMMVLGSAAFADGGTLKIDGLGTASADKLYVIGALDLSGVSDTIQLSGALDGVSDYTVAHAGSITGAFDNVSLSGLTGASGYSLISRQAVGGGYDLVLTVPEPAAIAVLGFAGALALRRRVR